VNNKNVRLAVLIALGLVGFWGVIGVIERLFLGHELANYGSYIPWGLWVSAYIYFVGLSAGAFLLASLVYVFRIEGLARVARPALLVSAITLLMGLLSIWLDIGHMSRFYEIFTRPNFNSLMAWMVWLYTAYFLVVLAELWLEMRVDLAFWARSSSRLAPLYRVLALGWRCPEDAAGIDEARGQSLRGLRVLAAIGIPLAIAFHGGVGALFAGLMARAYWHTALYPILFLTGALVSGGGLLLAVVAMTDLGDGPEGEKTLRLLGRAVLGLLIFDLILEWSEISIPAWYRMGEEYELFKTVLFGEYWYVFWIVHLLLGALVPLALLARRSVTRPAAGVAGALIAITFMAVRLNVVVPGQILPSLEGLERAYVDHRLLFSYVPSAFEWSVFAFVVVLGLMLYYLGSRYLPISGANPRPLHR